jgi:mono/diheme cytochrome c family protein
MSVVKILTGLALVAVAAPALAQAPAKASAGAYTKAQADRGAALFSANCARCHGEALEGVDVAPPLTGARFLANWTGHPVAALAIRIRTTMPMDNPGALGLAQAADVTAYILSQNGYPAGAAELPSGPAAGAVMLDAK